MTRKSVIFFLTLFLVKFNSSAGNDLPLYETIPKKHLEMVNFLLKGENNLKAFNKIDENGDTALHRAIFWLAPLEIISFFYENSNKKYINIKNNAGKTPLVIACENGNVEVINSLLDHGAKK
jgi:ankyrin repeat protein